MVLFHAGWAPTISMYHGPWFPDKKMAMDTEQGTRMKVASGLGVRCAHPGKAIDRPPEIDGHIERALGLSGRYGVGRMRGSKF
jgi:hypothetical protein